MPHSHDHAYVFPREFWLMACDAYKQLVIRKSIGTHIPCIYESTSTWNSREFSVWEPHECVTHTNSWWRVNHDSCHAKNEACHVTCEWVMSQMNELCHIWIRHVRCEWDMSHMNVTCHITCTYECDMSHNLVFSLKGYAVCHAYKQFVTRESVRCIYIIYIRINVTENSREFSVWELYSVWRV